jgi:hypothetical protein
MDRSFESKIDSKRTPFAHERFAIIVSLIPLLRADRGFRRFHTARVNRVVSSQAELLPCYLNDRTFSTLAGSSGECHFRTQATWNEIGTCASIDTAGGSPHREFINRNPSMSSRTGDVHGEILRRGPRG